MGRRKTNIEKMERKANNATKPRIVNCAYKRRRDGTISVTRMGTTATLPEGTSDTATPEYFR